MPNEEQRKKLIATLDERLRKNGRTVQCPMCGNKEFSLTNGYFAPVVQDDIGSLKLSGTAIPSASIICTNCGFVSQHALGTLGLLPPKDAPKTEGGAK